jgi:hypothetical protein
MFSFIWLYTFIIILYFVILYWTILYHIILYYILLYNIIYYMYLSLQLWFCLVLWLCVVLKPVEFSDHRPSPIEVWTPGSQPDEFRRTDCPACGLRLWSYGGGHAAAAQRKAIPKSRLATENDKWGHMVWRILYIMYPPVNITMENNHFLWVNPLSMAIFNRYVSLPEGNSIQLTNKHGMEI